jgi:hypothetical protein
MYKAKSIVENKFWILESEEGEKIGTVKIADNRVNVVVGGKPETFSSMDQAIAAMGLIFSKRVKEESAVEDDPKNEVYGYPTATKPHNALWNLQMKLPVYTKTSKSPCYHCAGYYIIRFATGWVKSYCPKQVTLEQNKFKGPFYSKLEMQEQLRLANDAS